MPGVRVHDVRDAIRHPAVIFFMDGLGIRPTIFEMGQRLADQGYVVLVPDLFYRAGRYEALEPKKVFASGDVRARSATCSPRPTIVGLARTLRRSSPTLRPQGCRRNQRWARPAIAWAERCR